MNFGQALEALKQGHRIKRAQWGGFWILCKQSELINKTEDSAGEIGLSHAFLNNFILASLKDGGGFAPAMPYQVDLLAEDWEILE